ncbi:MAG TPA: hypothetical protein VFT13_01220 [Candidatus Krumholzibacteria bacterium]|nr:hypothetical protein [Candidatus Krumholzibacteria bacterium]
MAGFLPATSERIDDLASELVLSLELQRGEGCHLAATEQAAARLVSAIHGAVVAAEELDRAGSTARVDDVCRLVESAYVQWKSVDGAFAQTIRLAYENQIPRHNLLLDDIRTALRQRAGEPIAEIYTELRHRWATHVDARPWDSFRNRAPAHVDRGALENALAALAHGDDLDVEDALGAITGDLRYAFADHLAAHSKDADDIELGLWKRPEMIVAGDFWGHPKCIRLLDVLAEHGSERSRATASQLAGFFAPCRKGAASVVRTIHGVSDTHRERFTRCLMLHPDYEVRRYAVNNTDLNSVWKVVTPDAVPCAAVLTLLERLVGSSRYTTAQRKVFFDAVYRRLLTLTNRSDVLYARGIARIFVKLNFFMEDNYFHKLSTLLDYVAVKEKTHGIADGVLADYIARVRREKEKAGALPGVEPSFDGIPLVVLRKIARDGHYWHTMLAHPIAKVAREVVPHVSTKDRALVTANNHRANPEVLRGLGRKRELFSAFPARMALLSNPQTPVAVSMNYVSDLSLRDVEALLRRATLHPELRHILRSRYEAARR